MLSTLDSPKFLSHLVARCLRFIPEIYMAHFLRVKFFVFALRHEFE